MFHSSILTRWVPDGPDAAGLPSIIVAALKKGPKYLPRNRNGRLSTTAPVFDDDCNHQLRMIERGPADEPRVVAQVGWEVLDLDSILQAGHLGGAGFASDR